ncbi:hypothetical protein NDU88_003766 [Pleurodeles waltl]|uniref:Uncharacterized protein n=1 Tax=Pleurodeles waltl TaxID=8319 RepID=A0AAV7LG69_PLEWA|nr:hypothetical protein NDU88_003766 [Pleurodeles waltl]
MMGRCECVTGWGWGAGVVNGGGQETERGAAGAAWAPESTGPFARVSDSVLMAYRNKGGSALTRCSALTRVARF